MFYVVSVAVLLIIVGIFTLDIIKIIIGLVVVIIMFLIYWLKLHKTTKDPVLFEMLKSITDLNREIDKEISNKRNYSLNDKKYMGIILLLHVGFVKAASDGAPIDEVKFKDLFYAAYNAMSFNLKNETINDLYNLYKNKSKHNIASGIILMGVQIYTFKLFNMSYIDKCLEAIDDLYNNPKIPNSIDDYFNTSNDNKENGDNINNKNPILDSNSISSSDHTKMKEAEQIYNTGVMYANGIAVEKDDKKAAEQGEERAINGLKMVENEIETNKNIINEEEYEVLLKAAKNGDAEAQCKIGMCCFKETEWETDYEEALKWFMKAAEQNYPKAQDAIGTLYALGKGIEMDVNEAIKWYKKAADQGFLESQYTLGLIYQNGQGVERNNNEAFNWFKKAADQGSPKSQTMVGILYLGGLGVKKDIKEGIKWLKKAAEQGYDDAQYHLGEEYYYGENAPKDIMEARKWLRKAADQGNEFAREKLNDIEKE